MSRKITWVLFASAAAVAAGPVGAQQKVRSLSPSDVRQAAQQHPDVVAQFGGAMSGPLATYVQDVGRRVAGQSAVRGGGAAYTFTTLNSPVMNAFAVPGGYVYVTRELVALANDEAELALVLGHEAGHIAANHSQKRQTSSIISQLGAAVLGAVTGSSGLGQLAGQVGQGLVLGYSRGQENEADGLGVRYMAAAGYDATAATGMLASLGAWDALQSRIAGADQEKTPSWARTHPLSADRAAKVAKLAAQAQPVRTGQRNRERYLAAIDGMIFDEDPRQGVIEGDDFVHPELRIRFTAPRGYRMQNGASAVTIAGTNGQAQFATGAFGGSLDSYIGQVFRSIGGNGIRIPQAERTTVNGIPAAYAITRASTQSGQVDVGVFAYQWDSNRAYHFVTLTRAGSGFGPFGSTVGSLRRLSGNEAAAIRPRVIEIHTVRQGDSIRNLADRMAYPAMKLERFLVLNSLDANASLRPGDKVKLVVYGNLR